MGYIYTAVVRDKEGKIITYGDYAEYQSPPENVTSLAAQPGNTLTTTSRKEGKGQYFNYAGELGARQAELRTTNERLLAERETAISQANAKARQLAQTTGNPFVSQGAREITRRKAVPVFQNLSNIQSQLEANYSVLDTVTPGSTIQKTSGAKARTDDKKSASIEKAQQAAQIYEQGKIAPDNPDFIAGGKAYDISDTPRNLTRVQAQEYNKGLIKAQQDLLRPTALDTTNKTPIPPTKNTQYVITDKNGSVFKTSGLYPEDIAALQRLGSKVEIETSITKYKVTDPSGRERTFNTKESADKFAERYGTKTEKITGVPGSLDYIYGQRPKVQGANLGEPAFFVGANAEGYLVDTKRKIEPRPTATDFFGNNPITRSFDSFFETNKPIAERNDDQSKALLFTNREIGELTAPFVNRALEAKDTITASATGGKFAWEPGFLGVPSYQPVKKSAKVETALDRLASGKPVDFTNKNERFSAYGSVLAFAGELFAFGKGVKGGTKAIEGAEKAAQVSKVSKYTKLTNEGQISGFTKAGDDTFIIQRGTEGKSITVNPNIESTLIGISKTGKPITTKTPKTDPPTGRFSWNTFARTKGETDPFAPTTQPPPNVPVSIVELGAASKFKGGSVTDFFKSNTLTKGKPGTPYIVEGEVNASLLKDFGLKEIRGAGSKEFGIQTSGKTLYRGILNEGNISKVLEAERFGFIKPYAVGKTAPLQAVLKRRPDLLREYAGAKTATTRTDRPIETIFSWKTLSRKPEVFGQVKPSKTKEITPILTNFFETSNAGIKTPESFGIVNKGKIKPGETRGVTGIGSKGLDRVLTRVGLSTAKEASKRKTNLRPFDFSDFAPTKGTGGSTGKGAALSLDEGLKAAGSYIKSKPVTAQPQDILFSSPRGLLPQYQGVQENNILAYPQGTPEKIKNQFRIDTGLETQSRVKLTSANSGDYFSRYGLETINIQDSKMDNLFRQIPISIQPTKQREKLKAIITPFSITGLGQTPIQSTGLKQTPITTTGLETVPVTELITTPITEPVPIPRNPLPPFSLKGFGIGFAGFGGGYDDRQKRKKGKKKYIVSSIDPFTPGSIVTAGVPEQQVSSRKSIYGKLDIQLGRARKRNQPKQKKFKDPFRL